MLYADVPTIGKVGSIGTDLLGFGSPEGFRVVLGVSEGQTAFVTTLAEGSLARPITPACL